MLHLTNLEPHARRETDGDSLFRRLNDENNEPLLSWLIRTAKLSLRVCRIHKNSIHWGIFCGNGTGFFWSLFHFCISHQMRLIHHQLPIHTHSERGRRWRHAYKCVLRAIIFSQPLLSKDNCQTIKKGAYVAPGSLLSTPPERGDRRYSLTLLNTAITLFFMWFFNWHKTPIRFNQREKSNIRLHVSANHWSHLEPAVMQRANKAPTSRNTSLCLSPKLSFILNTPSGVRAIIVSPEKLLTTSEQLSRSIRKNLFLQKIKKSL